MAHRLQVKRSMMSRRLAPWIVAAVLVGSVPVRAQGVVDRAGADEAIEALNALRTSEGLAPLERHPGLDRAARTHTLAMVEHRQLVHVLPGVGDPAERVESEGVVAEGLAQHVARGRTALAALGSLVSSDGHRQQMLEASLTHVGVTVVQSDEGVWMTQLLARMGGPASPEDPNVEAAQHAPPAGWQGAAASGPTAQVVSSQDTTPEVRVDSQGHRRIVGYWVRSEGRWWYYPRPAHVRSGQELEPDLSVQGPPPGHRQDDVVTGGGASARPADPSPTRIRVRVRRQAPQAATRQAEPAAPEPSYGASPAYAGYGHGGAPVYAAPMVYVVPPPYVVRRPFFGPRVVVGPYHPRAYRGWGYYGRAWRGRY
jgi:hypothetical protein